MHDEVYKKPLSKLLSIQLLDLHCIPQIRDHFMSILSSIYDDILGVCICLTSCVLLIFWKECDREILTVDTK